jgi:16S rRNA processing protein RimM
VDLIAVGLVRTSWGVKGWIKVASLSGEWDHFPAIKEVTLRKGDRNRSFKVEGFRRLGDAGALKLAGIENPEVGKTYAGWEILASRAHAAPLTEGEWYLADLVGLEVVGDGERFGVVNAVIEAADDLLEIRRSDGSTFMVPFRRDFVEEPDLDKGEIILISPWLAEKS